MPGKTTYYSRIQVMLELAGAKNHHSSEKFIRGIISKSPPNFVYHHWNPEKEEIIAQCSEAAVERTFELAVELELLEEKTGTLTEAGKQGADPGHYDLILRKQIEHFFQEHEISIEEIMRLSQKMLQNEQIILPTADEIYSTICDKKEVDIPLTKFRTLLQILAACGGIKISRRHIYLPINT